jgi:hypothetical protein
MSDYAAPKDFLVSYHSVDQAWAEWIARILEENKYTVTVQAWDVLPRDNLRQAMEQAAAGGTRTIAVLSDHYLKVNYTQPEGFAAFQPNPQAQEPLLIPIRVGDCKPDGWLGHNAIDIVGRPEAEAEGAILAGIAAALKKRSKAERGADFFSNPRPDTSTQPEGADRDFSLNRLDLFQRLSALTVPEFENLVFALNPPAGIVPDPAAPQGSRVSALLQWAESPSGQGIDSVQALLRQLLPLEKPAMAPAKTFPGQVQTQNPFLPLTGAVDQAEQFFNCDRTLDRIFEVLNSGSNVALIGDRNMGKSSLLREVARQAEHRLAPPRQSILINLVMLFSEEEFSEELCTKVNIEDCRGNKLNRALQDKRLLLILDEVERIVQDEFSRRVRDQLRGLSEGQEAPLRLVLAARDSLENLFPDSYDEGTMVSPLHGICWEENVHPWSVETMRQFIDTRLAPTPIRFSDDEITQILTTCSGKPKQLMQLCNELFREKGIAEYR